MLLTDFRPYDSIVLHLSTSTKTYWWRQLLSNGWNLFVHLMIISIRLFICFKFIFFMTHSKGEPPAVTLESIFRLNEPVYLNIKFTYCYLKFCRTFNTWHICNFNVFIILSKAGLGYLNVTIFNIKYGQVSLLSTYKIANRHAWTHSS